MSCTVLLTGASGFIGSALRHQLLASGRHSVVTTRGHGVSEKSGSAEMPSVPLEGGSDWSHYLAGVDVVVHCASRAYVMSDAGDEVLAQFREVNVEGTLALARQAVAAGVKRFVYISSIKVNGESTERGQPFRADSPAAPLGPFGISKLEAERGLQQLARESALEVVIIRPVMVYGAAVKGNFHRMMRWLDSGIPLPFGAIDNRRSMVCVDNLLSLIMLCMEHPRAANEVFLVSDGEDLSTTQLLQRLALALGKRARLLPVPSGWLNGLARLFAKPALAQRLCGSLQVDIEKTRTFLGWTPSSSIESGLEDAAHYFQERSRK